MPGTWPSLQGERPQIPERKLVEQLKPDASGVEVDSTSGLRRRNAFQFGSTEHRRHELESGLQVKHHPPLSPGMANSSGLAGLHANGRSTSDGTLECFLEPSSFEGCQCEMCVERFYQGYSQEDLEAGELVFEGGVCGMEM